MPLLHVLILAVVQGITEFLPISSSGHLVLTWNAFDAAGWVLPEDSDAERLVLDIAVHFGTLLAVMLYFWRDVAGIVLGMIGLAAGRRDSGARLARNVIVGTLPLIAVGFLLKDSVTGSLRDVVVIAWATVGFGVLLYLADRFGMTVNRSEHVGWGSALAIGLAQVLALIPGTSRAGITITAARICGFERGEAARFSMLLAIPAILGAAVLAGYDLYRLGDLQVVLDALVGAGFAFVAALVAITAMMAWLRRASYTPFVVYRLLMGGILLLLVYRTPDLAWFMPS